MIAIVALILAAAVLLGVLFLSDLERELDSRLDEGQAEAERALAETHGSVYVLRPIDENAVDHLVYEDAQATRETGGSG